MLFSEISADLLGTDDMKTLKLCKMFKIPYFSIISFILSSISEKKITKSRALLKLEKLGKIGWYKTTFLEQIMEIINKMEVE